MRADYDALSRTIAALTEGETDEVALMATVAAGFGFAGVITAVRGSGTDVAAFIRIALLAWALAAAMLGVGMVISALAT